MRSSSIMINAPSRMTTSSAKSDATGMFSAAMYSQILSSVQFDNGNTRMLPPWLIQPLAENAEPSPDQNQFLQKISQNAPPGRARSVTG